MGMHNKKSEAAMSDVTIDKDFIIRQARPYDYYDLCRLSEVIASRNRDEIDWEHSFIGISQISGRIAWGYIYSNQKCPEDIRLITENEITPVELIDIFACNENKRVFDSLAYHFWTVRGNYNKPIYSWRHTADDDSLKQLLFKKLGIRLYTFNYGANGKHLYWCILGRFGSVLWEQYTSGGQDYTDKVVT